MARAWTLTELCAREGYQLVVAEDGADRSDILGTPQRDELCAQACAGNVLVIRRELHDNPQRAFYALAHEIAEDRCDFTGHHQLLWREQTQLMARWLTRLHAALGAQP